MPTIPRHEIASDSQSKIAFKIEPLERKSHYDSTIPHRHNYYEIFLFTEGSGHHDIDFETIPIESNSVHFLSPGQVHQVRRGLDSSGYVIYFSEEFFYLSPQKQDLLLEIPFLNNNHPRPILNLNQEEWTGVMGFLQSIQQEYLEKGSYYEDLIRTLLKMFLIRSKRLFEHRSEFGTSPNENNFRQFRLMLERSFKQVHRVKTYASKLLISEKQLNEITRNAVGQTASELIYDRIILEAKRLLLFSNMSSKEIAFHLHFDDPSHFSKFFKKKTTYSPSVFRDWVRDNYGK